MCVVCCVRICFSVGLCCLRFVVDWHMLSAVLCLLNVDMFLVVGC